MPSTASPRKLPSLSSCRPRPCRGSCRRCSLGPLEPPGGTRGGRKLRGEGKDEEGEHKDEGQDE
eukprot:8545815-Pyramimonas_sp.AAC.1